MLRMRFLGWMFPIVVLLPASEMASGQSFPTKVIGIVVGGIGGSLDITARLIAQGVAAPLGQPVIVENRASVTIAADVVAKAPADGYTLLMTGSNLWILPLLESKPSFDPVGDFSAVTLATRSPSVLVIHPSLPVKSVKELIALAKARPGELNYASGSSGHQKTDALIERERNDQRPCIHNRNRQRPERNNRPDFQRSVQT